jgi:hypothetical protein
VKDTDKKTQPAKPAAAKPTTKSATEKIADTPLVIPDKIPTDPAENAKLAGAVLERAEKNMRGEGYIKTFVAISGELPPDEIIRSIVKIYVKSNPDGTRWKRKDQYIISRDNLKKVTKYSDVLNDTGTWEIIGNRAIKMAYFDKVSADIQKREHEFGLSDGNKKLQCKKIKYNNISCILVMEDRKKVAVQYVIGEENGFIYKTTEYDRATGKITYEMIYDNVVINVSIKDEMFEVNKEYKIMIADSEEKHIDLPIEAASYMEENCLFPTQKEVEEILSEINN